MKLLIAFAMAFFSLQAIAQSVSESEARQQAQAFLQERGKSLKASTRMRSALKSQGAAGPDDRNEYYVFNVDADDGFVIVSGDSRTTPILGYADQGNVTADDMPDGLRFLLECYAEEISSLDDDNAVPAARQSASRTPARHAIAPFVVSRWDQDTPYCDLCPDIDGEKCVTGCVATAMAQVMYYHRWPKVATTDIPGYSSRNKLHKLDELPSTAFAWDEMTATYNHISSGTPDENAVATLMQYCGWSIQMNYNVGSEGGSSAYNGCVADALKCHFGYDATYAQRQHYSYADWMNMVYDELAEGHPVILGGQSTGGGHSFVCDGYEGDDYFHINWGWSGQSDGFFRLSALTPYEQGIGGSSTLDGFSFTQDAVVGIQPRKGDTAPTCLSLEKLQFDVTGTTTAMTLSREDSNAAFTGLSLYLLLANYSYITTSYDYAVAFTDGGTSTDIIAKQTDVAIESVNEVPYTISGISTPSALADGVYAIKVLSRANGQTDWQECYDGAAQQLSAVVEGNTMTVSTAIVSGTGTLPTGVTFDVEGNRTQGYEQTVVASVTGGETDYYGNLVLRVNGKAVMGKSVEIPAHQTVAVRFSYIPTTSGDNILSLWNAKSSGTQIGSAQTFPIAESDATNDLDLTFSATIDNLTDVNGKQQLYGNALRATVTVGNPSDSNTYVGMLNCSVRQWTKTEETTDNGDGSATVTTYWSWESLGVTRYPIIVSKGGTTIVHVAADDLPAEGFYSFRLTYQRTTDNGNIAADAIHLGINEQGIGTLTMTGGYRLGDATGATTIFPPSSVVDAADACFVDLRGLTTLDGIDVTPSSNPNCLYLLPSKTEGTVVPASLSGRNVVCGTEADDLKLTDGYDFYSPINFTADRACYTRTFTQPATGTAGWTTLMLPFDATTVTVSIPGGSDIKKTWFRSDEDEEGSFWLRAFTADGEGIVAFDHAQQLTANTPYIIAVPGDTWGSQWQMTNRPVTFSTTGAHLAATSATSLFGNSYKFCGTTIATTVNDAYVLNDQGSRFVSVTADTPVPAFRAWFLPVSISSLTLPALAIGSPDAIAADILPDANGRQANGYYTLDGRCLHTVPTAPGLYIHNGKKLIIK